MSSGKKTEIAAAYIYTGTNMENYKSIAENIFCFFFLHAFLIELVQNFNRTHLTCTIIVYILSKKRERKKTITVIKYYRRPYLQHTSLKLKWKKKYFFLPRTRDYNGKFETGEDAPIILNIST